MPKTRLPFFICATVACLTALSACDAREVTAAPSASPQRNALPTAIACYQGAANAEQIDAYMACFSADAPVVVDVSRTIAGRDAIRRWALAEVMPNGRTFQHRAILEQKPGFAKTEVKWMSWVVHYSYWWNDAGLITKMDLQYAP